MRIGTNNPGKGSRVAYLLVTAALGVGGVLAARSMGATDTGAVALGVATAWLIQAVAFWMLHRALATRRRVIPIWVAGMVSRAGAIGVLWVAARAAGQLSSRDLLMSYVIAILVFLILEAAWLAIGAPAGLAKSSDIAE